MKIKLILLLLSLSSFLFSQECSPYYPIKSFELSKVKHAGVGYVACLHARGLLAEVGYDNTFIGVLAMGKGHHHSTYSYLQYEFAIRELRIYGGPAYRLNNDPQLLIGRVGADYPIYKPLHATFSLLQINNNLNYIHIGFKLVL